MIRYATAGFVFCLCMCSAPAGWAQRTAAADVHLRKECRKAAQIIRLGRPESERGEAYALISNCGADGGAALADALAARRLTDRIAPLDSLTRPASELRDGRLFEAAFSVATDRTSSPVARVFALRVVFVTFYRGAVPTFEQFTGSDRSRGCLGEVLGLEGGLSDGSPVAPDAARRALELSRRTLADATEPALVRAAARCAYGGLRYHAGP
ncbi:MAG: hypothetical protein JWM27_3958 [Gemmatimonadetes bacterium]|nr:hypothetical protein [Gemmatimonadota bacterium]